MVSNEIRMAELKCLYERGENISSLLRRIRSLEKNDESLIEAVYDLQAGTYNEALRDEAFKRIHQNFTRGISQTILSLCQPANVLETGVGDGTTLAGVIDQMGGAKISFYGFGLCWSRVANAMQFTRHKGICNVWLCTGNLLNIPPVENLMVLNLVSTNNQVRGASIQQVKKSIDFCHELELELYSFHSGFIGDVFSVIPDRNYRNFDFKFKKSDVIDWSSVFELFIDSLKRICDHAAMYDMKLVCENSGSISKNEFCLMSTQEEFERVDYPYLGMLLDLGHLKLSATSNRFEPETFVSALQSRIYELHVHENDGVYDQHRFLYPGCRVLHLVRKFDFPSALITLEGRNLTPAQTRMSYQSFLGTSNFCGLRGEVRK